MPVIRRPPSDVPLRHATRADEVRAPSAPTTSARPLVAEGFAGAGPAAGFAERWPNTFPGYRWDAAALDDVMRRFGVGDAFALLQTAVALDAGDRYLSKDELIAAAKEQSAHVTKGFRWSPRVLANVMQRQGLAEEGALLRAAKKLDDGDKQLGRAELERAAEVLTGIVGAHDHDAILARVDALRGVPGFTVTDLGAIDGKRVPAVHVPCSSGDPKLRVVVTGGVHGDEPCGAAAATLLLEQLKGDPRLREDVEWLVIPVVNPRGLVDGTRRTPEGVDVNRTLDGHHDHVEETRLLTSFLEGRSYDLGLDLHSGRASRDGFWTLHRDSEDILAPALARFDDEWPLLHRDTKPYSMAQPGVATSENRGTLKDFHQENGARWSITVEAPGSLSYLDQVLGENELLHQLVVEARAQSYADS